MPPTVGITIASKELGLPRGTLPELDNALRRFERERIVLRIVSILNVLGLGGFGGVEKAQVARGLAEDYVKILPRGPADALAASLADPRALFFEPWQQLMMLKRALVVSPVGIAGLDFMTAEGETDGAGFRTYVEQV